jgi:PhnB protein
MRYKDAPPEDDYEIAPDTQDLIMHAQFEVDGEMIMLCDVPPEHPATIGNNITLMAEFDSADKATSAFNALKDGGEVTMELQETFWSKHFGSLTDKFGINWHISVGCPQ